VSSRAGIAPDNPCEFTGFVEVYAITFSVS